MKVIFLDMDGVMLDQHFLHNHKRLNTLRIDHSDRHVAMVDPACVERLNKITETTGASIVWSSCWRKLYKHDASITLFKKLGIKAKFLGRTISGETRSGEILFWIKENPEITEYLVIDDEPDCEPWTAENQPILFPHYVKTYWNPKGERGGLQDKHIARCLEILNHTKDDS